MHGLRALVILPIVAVAVPLVLTMASNGARGADSAGLPPTDVSIEITDGGFSPAPVIVPAGANLHWTNDATGEQSVVSEEGLFDSGPLAPGDGFTVNLRVPGHHSYHSANTQGFVGELKVVLAGLGGSPNAMANDHIPDVPFPAPDPNDYSIHPQLAARVSRTTIYLGFNDTATVAEANDALGHAGVGLAGGIPAFKTLVGEVEDSGDFTRIDAAIAALRSEPAIAFAAPIREIVSDAVPRVWESPSDSQLTQRTWDVVQAPAGSPGGAGDNYGLEMARFPQAWNLMEVIRARAADISTGLLEVAGFPESHPDLGDLTTRVLCTGLMPPGCTSNMPDDHAAHVAGIVGAAYDNPAPGGTRSIGMSGTNPLAHMDGFSLDGRNELSVWRSFLDRVATDVSNIRVVNYSVGWGGPDVRTWWDHHMFPTCGPGANDDGAPGSNEWCDWTNDDTYRSDLASGAAPYRFVADIAARTGITIVKSAGNYASDLCGSVVDANGDKVITTAEINAFLPANATRGNCSAGLRPYDAQFNGGFAWAARHWLADPNISPPPILVEAHDINRARANFSNFGDVSAPGVDIYSTKSTSPYGKMSGTSMAAPHVTGLVSYLLAFDPTLTPAAVRKLIVDWARVEPDVSGRAPRLDAFMSLMAIPGAVRNLVDINDATRDGDLRSTLMPTGPRTMSRLIPKRHGRHPTAKWTCGTSGASATPGSKRASSGRRTGWMETDVRRRCRGEPQWPG